MAAWCEDPKPTARHVATRAEWKRIRAHFEFAVCVATGLRHQCLHHVVFRSEGGDDFIENFAPLTDEAHDRFHSRAPGWERVAGAIRAYVMADPGRRLYAEAKLGERFNRRYPVMANADERFERDFRIIYPPLEAKDLP